MGEDLVSKTQGGLPPRLHPHSDILQHATSFSHRKSCFSLSGSCCSGFQVGLLPVDTHLKTLLFLSVFLLTFTFRWPSRNGEKHFGSFSDVCFLTVIFFRWRGVLICVPITLLCCLTMFFYYKYMNNYVCL